MAGKIGGKMARASKERAGATREEAPFGLRTRKPAPFEFVLEAIASLNPSTKRMFGCVAVYVKGKIVFLLCDKTDSPDCGVWLATTAMHHESLRVDFPNMRRIVEFWRITGWQNLPANSPDFEEAALKACELVLAGDGSARCRNERREPIHATLRSSR